MFSCKFEYEKDWAMPSNLSELGRAISERYPASNFASLTSSLFSDKIEVIAEFGTTVDDALLKEICMFIYSYKEDIADDETALETSAAPALVIDKALNISEISVAEKTMLFEKLAALS